MSLEIKYVQAFALTILIYIYYLLQSKMYFQFNL